MWQAGSKSKHSLDGCRLDCGHSTPRSTTSRKVRPEHSWNASLHRKGNKAWPNKSATKLRAVCLDVGAGEELSLDFVQQGAMWPMGNFQFWLDIICDRKLIYGCMCSSLTGYHFTTIGCNLIDLNWGIGCSVPRWLGGITHGATYIGTGLTVQISFRGTKSNILNKTYQLKTTK